LMCIYLTSKVIDRVQLHTSATKLIMIVTENEEKSQALIHEGIDRSLTKVKSVGGYSNEPKRVIFCVAEQQEAVYLRKKVQEEEPAAFVVFIHASEILGRGFSLDKYYGQKL